MSLYLKQIEQLIALQKVDAEIHIVKKNQEEAPLVLESLKEQFQEVSVRRERQQDKMSHLHEQEKRLGIEIQDEVARIEKSKNKMMLAENSKEYNAMVREMDTLEQINRDREHEKRTLVEELLTQTAIQKELDEKYESLEKEVSSCESGLQKKIAENEAILDELNMKRKESAREVPAPVFARYEFIRERLKHPVIVPVEKGICSGCHIAIPPQAFIELQKGTQILSCPNCQRLMFWFEHFSPKVEENE